MDLAAFGHLVITEGASATTVVLPDQPPNEIPTHTAAWSGQDKEQADVLFATAPTNTTPSLAATLMVVTAGAMTLKGVVLDEGEGKKEKKEESPQALPRRKNDGNQNVPD